MNNTLASALSSVTIANLSRTLRRGAGLLTLSALSLVAYAQQPASVQLVDAESLRVRIDNAEQQTGRVRVVDTTTGQTLFAEDYAASAYGRRFNFRHMPAGRYTLVMSVGPSVYRYTVQVQVRDQASVVSLINLKARLQSGASVAVIN